MADSSSRNPFAAFGHRLIEAVWKLGFVCRFFAAILRDSGASLRRFPLVIREIYFAGVLSMIASAVAPKPVVSSSAGVIVTMGASV